MIAPWTSSGGRVRKRSGEYWLTSLFPSDTVRRTETDFDGTSKAARGKSLVGESSYRASEKMAKNFPSSFQLHRFKIARTFYSLASCATLPSSTRCVSHGLSWRD